MSRRILLARAAVDAVKQWEYRRTVGRQIPPCDEHLET